MIIKTVDYDFSICKVVDYSLVDVTKEYVFIGKTKDENSLVCITDDVPSNVSIADHGWKAFYIDGILDFSLVGILANITEILAEEKISVFAVSTYNTDYIFIKEYYYLRALDILKNKGYEIE